MYRFLASRRWLVRTLAGLVLVAVCIRLGIWQLDRAEQRTARNDVIAASAEAAPVAVDDLLTVDAALASADEWRQVEVRGEYDVDHQFLLVLRPFEGDAGVHVITPLVTDSGAALLVDRGFLATDGPADELPEVDPPAPGQVEVVARVRRSEVGRGPGGDPAAGSVRYLDVDAIADSMPYPLYRGWAEVVSEDPPAAASFQALPPPEIDAGPHLSYAIQWFLFATVGLGGYVLLIRAEARGRRELDRELDATPTAT